jgi:hypothetical protein
MASAANVASERSGLMAVGSGEPCNPALETPHNLSATTSWVPHIYSDSSSVSKQGYEPFRTDSTHDSCQNIGMKKKDNKIPLKTTKPTVASVAKEMQKPRMTESVRNGLRSRSELLTIERPTLDWKAGKSRRTTPGQKGLRAFFHITHPFHPLFGQELERASGPPQESHRWVWFHTAEGRLSPIPLNFTDLVDPDPFVVVSAGRAHLGVKEMLRLVELLSEMEHGRGENV